MRHATVHHSHSPDQTYAIATAFAQTLKAGDVVAFSGGMGAGKTTFVAGIGAALSAQGEIASPTFALVHEYPLLRTTSGDQPEKLVHFDLYRLEPLPHSQGDTLAMPPDAAGEALEGIGWFDYLDPDLACILLIEWSERVPELLPPHTIFVDLCQPNAFDGEAEQERIITVSFPAEAEGGNLEKAGMSHATLGS